MGNHELTATLTYSKLRVNCIPHCRIYSLDCFASLWFVIDKTHIPLIFQLQLIHEVLSFINHHLCDLTFTKTNHDAKTDSTHLQTNLQRYRSPLPLPT
jgi:hypothetical protein